MKTHLSISLYIEKEVSPFSFDEFKTKMSKKIEEQLLEWKSEVLEIPNKKRSDDKLTEKELHNFRHSIHNLILSNYHITEMNIQDQHTYSINFNVNKIVNSDYHIKDEYESMFKTLGICEKGYFNIVDIITELTVKIKSSFYAENLAYMFENKVDEVSEELKRWSNTSKHLKRISHYL